jgi:hypothetical protein
MSNRIQFLKNLPVSSYPDLQLCKFLLKIVKQMSVVFQACKHQLSPSKAEHEQQPKRLIASYWKAFGDC